MNASYEGKTLIVSGRRISMPYPIEQILPLPDKVIVLLNDEDMPSDDPLMGRNVAAFDKDGNMAWRIPLSTVTFIDDHDREWPCPYSYLAFAEDGCTIQVYETSGVRHDLDPATGELSNSLFTR